MNIHSLIQQRSRGSAAYNSVSPTPPTVLSKADIATLASNAKLSSLMQEAAAHGLSYMPPTITNQLPSFQVLKIIDKIAEMYGISFAASNVAISLLFLKGASNSSTPNTISVTITYGGKPVTVVKRDLDYHYEFVTKNKHVRRLAETMRNGISQFAEATRLNGDLAQQINNRLLANGQEGLTMKQRAWTSSFNQFNPYLETDPDLLFVAQELAKD